MTDLTAPNARAERDSLAIRTDVLDKVKVLSLLPDDMHATTEQVANYFEVGIETVKNVVKRNRDEIEDDGYRTVTRSAFEERFTMNLPSSASTIALFPRRAILRIAMLLRDSTVARQVRTYLLDTEEGTRELDDDAIVLRALEIQTRKIKRLTDQVAELEPKAEYVDTFVTDEDVLSFSTVASTVGLQESKLRELLIDHDWIYKETASRWSRSEQRKKKVNRYTEKASKKAYFQRIENHDAPRFRGEVMHTLKITPPGAHAIAKAVARWAGEGKDAA